MATIRPLPRIRFLRATLFLLTLLNPLPEVFADPFTVNGGLVINNRVKGMDFRAGEKAVLVEGARVSSLTVAGEAEVLIKAGAKVDFLKTKDHSNVTAETGAEVVRVEATGHSTVSLNGGMETGYLDASDNAAVSVNKRAKVSRLTASGHAKVTLGEGAEVSHLTGSGDSRVHIQGGGFGGLYLSGNSQADIRKAVFKGVNLSTQTVSVSGGVITFTADSTIHLHAGEVSLRNGKVTGVWEDGERFSFWLIEGNLGNHGPYQELRRSETPPKQLVVHSLPAAEASFDFSKAPPVVEGGASIKPLPFKRYPFMPRLRENQDEELCRLALEDATERFLSTEIDPPLNASGREHFRWLDWAERMEPEELEARGKWTLLELDLDGTGRKQALLQQKVPHSWRGDNYSAFVFPSREAAEQALRRGPSANPQKRKGDHASPLEGGTMYHPEATAVVSGGTDVLNANEWAPSSLFEFKGRYYFYENNLQAGRNYGEVIGLFRLRSDGKVERRCAIQVLPEQGIRRALFTVPGVASYLKVLEEIGGASGGDCGTLRAGARHDYGAMTAAERACYRPWATSRRFKGIFSVYYVYDGTMLSFMRDWSFGDVWSRREFQTYLEHVPAAVRGLEQYYQKAFGMGRKDAKEWATRVFEEMTAAWFLIPERYEAGGGVYLPGAEPLMNAILTGSTERAGEFLSHSRHRVEAKHLHAAAESPEITRRILDAGVDVDAGNEFGKTALMTAAHMNRPDVVRLLLERKADPARKTREVSSCGTVIERGDRTALMYAAENAGPEVIKLLLDAGADPEVRDSRGNGISFYLQRNPWLTPEQRRTDIRTVAASASGEPKGASFDCRGASTSVERLICGDEVLRMQDRALAAAFARWLTLGGGGEAGSEQREWLKRRDKECIGMDRSGQVSCLQQKTRSRIRYLHNRIAEHETTGLPSSR